MHTVCLVASRDSLSLRQKINKLKTTEREKCRGLGVKPETQKNTTKQQGSSRTEESQRLMACSLGQDYTC